MKRFIFSGAFIILVNSLFGQEGHPADLFKVLKQRDSLIFNVGFNQCNQLVYDSIIADDVEFYHDKGGITKGKAAFIASAKNNICGGPTKVKRELVDSSLAVFPLYDNKKLYGAIQQGVHQFFHMDKGNWEYSGSAKFTHLWLLEDNIWKLKRVLSYDH